MKRIIFLMALVTGLFSCEKKELEKPFNEGITVRVRLVGHVCGDVMYEIVDDEFKSLGERNFSYGDKTFDAVFQSLFFCDTFTHQVLMASQTPTTIFTVKLYKKQPPLTGSCTFCLALMAKRSKVFYYVLPG